MSVTAVGPAFAIVGPPPEPRRHGLLTIPDVIVRDGGTPRWLTQVNVIGYPTGTPGIWEPCSEGTFRVKEEGEPRPQDRWDPFTAFFPLSCSSLGMGDYSEFYDQAEAALDATISHAVEFVLSQGVSTNPFFGDTDLTGTAILAGAAVSPRIGLSYLENAIGVRTGRQGMIHATPAIVDAWGAGGGIDEDAADGILRTTNGTPVVSGSGYIGADPVDASAPSPSGTVEWAFATGPIEVRIEDEARTRVDESLDRADNTVVVRAEKYVLAEWDKALQVGIRIDWSLSP